MRTASILFSLAAWVALVTSPVAMGQTAPEKAQQAKSAVTKSAAKTTDSKATKVEGATAVRTTPADMKKSGQKDSDGCSHSKTIASDA